MEIRLLQEKSVHGLKPLSLTRQVADLRLGIFTIREKWQLLGYSISEEASITVPSNIIPNHVNHHQIVNGQLNPADFVWYPWDLYQKNAQAIQDDVQLLSTPSLPVTALHSSNRFIGNNVFIEPDAQVFGSIINSTEGVVYIGKNALVMEGSTIRGPVSIGEHAVVKMGTQLYGGVTIGPYCTVGGEIKNSILMGYSNKAHHGYLGDSVIGEWCNLGAGTSNSNIKNTASNVRFKYGEEVIETGLIKGGLIMGDFSRTAINTSFNTGTIVGVCCNVFGDGFLPNYIPDFTWGNKNYIFENALRDISNWKKLKNNSLTEQEIILLQSIYQSKYA